MELIDRDALEVVTAKVPKSMDAKSYIAGMEYVLGQIDALPTIEERKTGKWVDYSEDGYVECPFCHSATNCDDNIDELHFCFSCGARLVQEGEDNDRA